jgi:hypothetical protein
VFHFHFPLSPKSPTPFPLSHTIFPSSQLLAATTIATAGHTIQCLRSSIDHHIILMERRPEPSFSLSRKPPATIGDAHPRKQLEIRRRRTPPVGPPPTTPTIQEPAGQTPPTAPARSVFCD